MPARFLPAAPSSDTGVDQVPELSSDGSQVLFGATESGYVAWSVGAGLRELEPEHLPTDGVLGTPMLAPMVRCGSPWVVPRVPRVA